MASKREGLDKAAARGDSADRVFHEPAFGEAMRALIDMSVRDFQAAKTPEETWGAHLRYEAAIAFGMLIKAYLSHGKAAIAQLREADAPQAADAREVYLEAAKGARAAFLKSIGVG